MVAMVMYTKISKCAIITLEYIRSSLYGGLLFMGGNFVKNTRV